MKSFNNFIKIGGRKIQQKSVENLVIFFLNKTYHLELFCSQKYIRRYDFLFLRGEEGGNCKSQRRH